MVEWTHLEEVAPTEVRTFLRITPLSGLVIPHENFDDRDDLTRFLDLARAARTST